MTELDDLFRRESAHLVAALVRLLGPAHVALAEDVAQDALLRAMHAWRLGLPERPRAWLLQVAKHRAIDELRRRKRFAEPETEPETEVELALSPAADAGNQLAMMFAICDDALAADTHVTLILRWLCGLSSAEIARAFLVDTGTIDRRLHRGRARLASLATLEGVDLGARQPSLERALYLLFNEGYHGSDPDGPMHPALCADAIRLLELLLEAPGITAPPVHALAALCCCNAARLATRLDADGVLVPLVDQDRTRWDRALIERGIRHLGASASGARWTRWHLEAGIAFEHARAPSVAATRWAAIVDYYDALAALAPGPVVALNRGLAVAELHGVAAGRAALAPLAGDPQLAGYSFYWAARADLARRDDDLADAVPCYQRAIGLAASRAERASYERRLAGMPAARARL